MTPKQVAAIEYLKVEEAAGRVGTTEFYHEDSSPCCALGHLAYFLAIKTIDLDLNNGILVLEANDVGNFPEVLRLLREAWGEEVTGE